MRTWSLFICGVLFLCGCASVQKQKDMVESLQAANRERYQRVYENALAEGNIASVIKEGSFQRLKARIMEYFSVLNYQTVLYSDANKGIIVFAKTALLTRDFRVNEDFPCQILLAYRAVDSQTRIEVTRATNITLTNKEVDKDLAAVYDMIRRSP